MNFLTAKGAFKMGNLIKILEDEFKKNRLVDNKLLNVERRSDGCKIYIKMPQYQGDRTIKELDNCPPTRYKKSIMAKKEIAFLTENYVAAGFPSPAASYIENPLDLNEHLVKHPAATFFVRVMGESMTGAGIFPGDVLVVDRSLEASSNMIVIAAVDGEFTVKRLIKNKSRIVLEPENSKFKPIEINEETDFQIWGVVAYTIHSFIGKEA
jgi:DNA polymerase V